MRELRTNPERHIGMQKEERMETTGKTACERYDLLVKFQKC